MSGRAPVLVAVDGLDVAAGRLRTAAELVRVWAGRAPDPVAAGRMAAAAGALAAAAHAAEVAARRAVAAEVAAIAAATGSGEESL